MKRIYGAILLSSLIVGLAGCGGNDKVGNGDSKVQLSEDTTVIRSNGTRPLLQPQPIVYLHEGPVKIEEKVKASNDTGFSSSFFSYPLSAPQTAQGTIYGEGNHSSDNEITISNSQYYIINMSGGKKGETQNSGEFNGKWEVRVSQKQVKDDEFKNRLHFALLDQSLGGELESKLSDNFYSESYTDGLIGFRVKDENAVSFFTLTNDDSLFKSEMSDGKWTSKEKEIGKISGVEEFKSKHPDAEHHTFINTSNGEAALISNNNTYYLVFIDPSLKPKKLDIPKKDIENLDKRIIFWEEKTNVLFASYIDKENNPEDGVQDTYIQKYDVDKQKFVKNSEGSNLLTKMPFEKTYSGGGARYFATGEDGFTYILNTVDLQSSKAEVVALDKKYKQATKIVEMNVPYASKENAFAIAAYKGRVDIWNIYDSRTLVNVDYNNPLDVGVNRYTFTLQ